MLGGLIVASVFYRLELLKDPVDVVGVPLLTGYSESNEQWSFYTFVFATLLCSFGLRHVAARMPAQGTLPLDALGALDALTLLSLPAWSNSPWNLPAVTVAGVFSFMAGLCWVRLDLESAKTANLTVMIGFTLWAIGFPDLPVTLGQRWTFPLA